MKTLLRFIVGVCLVNYVPSGVLAQELSQDAKFNGVSLVSPPRPVNVEAVNTVKTIAAGWVAIIPYAFSRQNEPTVYFDEDRQWWGERTEGARELISMSGQCGQQVMLKPHIWLGREWIGDFNLDSDEKWQAWRKSYEDYILNYAQVAQEMCVPLFCIGTEIKISAINDPGYWRDLIAKVRSVYGGKLTYAANWDSYDKISFWGDLDYIGIDAYFPLVHEPHPDPAEIEKAWVQIKDKMKGLSAEVGRPVLFTEYGYQSVNGAAGNHWEVNKSLENLNMELQAMAYECMFKMLWEEEWFAGGFLWKWHLRDAIGGLRDPHFTPQGKPAEEVIKKWYARN